MTAENSAPPLAGRVSIILGPGVRGADVVGRVTSASDVRVDAALGADPEAALAVAAERPDDRFVVVVRHPFAGGPSDAAREVEDAWVDATGTLLDVVERLGDRGAVVRWEDLVAGQRADLDALPGGPRPLVGGDVPSGHRPSRAARALAVELGYDLEPSTLSDVIRPVPRGDRVVASSAQRRLLFMDALEPGLAMHHLPAIRRITGPLDVEALARALSAVVARHEALRTDYELVDGEWYQVIRPPTPVPLSVEDLRASPELLSATIAAEVGRPFDLATGLKLRALVVRTADDEHVLVVTMHHIASDGSSIVRLTTDMAVCYAAAARGEDPTLPALPLQYADFTIWQQAHAGSAEFRAQVDHWRETLAGTLPVLDLPTDRSRPTTAHHEAGSVPFHLDADLTARWRAAARANGVTPFMFLLATYAATIVRWSGADDVVIGIANANRRAETEELIGLFASTLPVRLGVDQEAPFTALLDEVKRTTLGTLANQDVPFDEIVRVVNPPRDLSRSPIFQTLFVLNNMRGAVVDGDGGGLRVEELPVPTSAVELDLAVTLEEGPSGLGGRVDYAAALFDEATIRRFVGHWTRLLEAATTEPESPLGALPMLSADERTVLVDEFASPTAWPSAVEGVARLDELVSLRALVAPDAPAFEHRGDRITYGELDRRANQVARCLVDAGVEVGDRVGVAVVRSTWMPVAVLAVLKCGAAYVPLDPDLPADRIALMVEDAEVRVAVTSDGFVPAADVRCIDVDAARDAIAAADDGPLGIDTSALPGGGAAWVIYTSGSTGRPKGVEVEHASAINFVLAMAHEPGITPDDVVLAVPTLSFDPSVLDLFLPALVGARVVIASREDIMDGRRLSALIASSGATLMQATPTTWSMLLQSGWTGAPALKALCGGEAMPTELARRLRATCGEVWNIYGPTETTVWSTVHRVDDASLEHVNVPIGRPIPNLVYRVVDPFDRPVPIGVPGELLIGGIGVARGYFHRPELTAEQFVTDPLDPAGRVYRSGDVGRWLPDGSLEFLGRRDFQVKLRGNRIELGEIEAALRSADGVAEAAVVADGGAVATRLVGFVMADDPASPPVPADLRVALQQHLPGPMIPGAIVVLDTFPLTPSGKIDRRALPMPDAGGPTVAGEHIRPRDAVEARVAGWFATVLGVDEVGIYDDFFDLGGHSLIAVQLFATIEAETGMRIPLAALFESPTVAALAERLRSDPVAAGRSAFEHLVPITTTGDRVPLYCVHGSGGNVLNFRDLAVELGPTQPFYGLQARGIDGVAPPHQSIEAMASAYLAEIRAVQPHGPYVFAGYSGGGLVAYEMARQLQLEGESVDHVVLFDTFPPILPAADNGLRARFERFRSEGIRYVGGVVIRLYRRRAAAIKLREVDELLARGGALPPELRETSSMRSFHGAAARYVRQPYDGRTTLIRIETLYYAHRALTWAYGWDEFVAPEHLAVVRVAGSHNSLMQAEFVRQVAAAFRASVWDD